MMKMILKKKAMETTVIQWIVIIAVAVVVLIIIGAMKGTWSGLWEKVTNALMFG